MVSLKDEIYYYKKDPQCWLTSVGSNTFSAQFIKTILTIRRLVIKLLLQQTACLLVNPIMVCNFAFLFNCTPAGQASDSTCMMVLT